jgi:uncharacterized membrane protein YcaP (DUF421 family)
MHIEPSLLAFADSALQNMFYLDPEKVTWLEKILRPVGVYAALIILLRVFGKRELAQLNPFDLVVLLTLSNTVQNAIIGDDTSLSGGLVGALTLLGLNYGVAFLKFASVKMETLIEGKQIELIKNGVVDYGALKRELLTKEDLDVVAHREGYESSDNLETCILDPNGSFLVCGKDEVSDIEFKRQMLKKINKLSKQLGDLQKALPQP